MRGFGFFWKSNTEYFFPVRIPLSATDKEQYKYELTQRDNFSFNPAFKKMPANNYLWDFSAGKHNVPQHEAISRPKSIKMITIPYEINVLYIFGGHAFANKSGPLE